MNKQKKDAYKKRTRTVLSWAFSLALVSTMVPTNALAAVAADNTQTPNAVQAETSDSLGDVSAQTVGNEAGEQQTEKAVENEALSEKGNAAENTPEAAEKQAAKNNASEGKKAGADKKSAQDSASEKEEAAKKDMKSTEISADFVDNGGVEAADVQGKAAKSEAAAREELAKIEGVSAQKASKVAARLFGAGEDEGTEVAEIPRSGDGNNIDTISAAWITKDTVDNTPANATDAEKKQAAGFLYVKPSGKEMQTVRLQVSYALSGEHNYGAGDVTITVPAYIFKNRAGKDYGAQIIPFPEDPSTKGDFNWKLIGGNYILTNTKKMSAATTGYIQFAFTDMYPQDLVDMAVSKPFSAYIEVVTTKGNTIALRSNELTAQFDTQAKITQTRKKVYDSPERVKKEELQIPPALVEKYKDETEFIKVKWYAWGSTDANTLYDLSIVDKIPVKDGATEYDGFIVGATSEDGSVLDKGVVCTTSSAGQTGYYYFTTAYPASQFKPDTDYTFHNDVDFTVTEKDAVAEVTNPNVDNGNFGGKADPQLVTTTPASAKTTWSYTDPKWYDPTGHFMVVKNGNDDHEQNGTAKYNYTHYPKYSGEYSDLHIWARRSPINGWYGIYPSALNNLQDERIAAEAAGTPEDGGIRLSYTIDSVGYVMPWMFDSTSFARDGAVASRRSANYTRPVTMTTTDTGVSIGRYGDKLKIGEDYDLVSVEFPEEPWVYTGIPQNINPDGSWKALTAGDGTFNYARDLTRSHWPDIKLQVQLDGQWQDYATASWKSGQLQITRADGTTVEGSVIDMPQGAQNFRTQVTLVNTSAAEDNLALQAAIDYDVRPVIKLKSTDEMMELVKRAFKNSNTPEMFVYNSVNMLAERADVAADAKDREIVSIDKDGYDSIRGYTTDVMVYPSKTSEQNLRDADYETRTVTIHYNAKVEERSVINDRKTYEQAIADGRLMAETHGFWRDLLPIGVTPKIDTVKLRDKDRPVDVYTIENYENSGRTLLVVEADLTPTPQRYKSGDMYYYEDVPTISFDATYDFDSIKDYGTRIHNVISFESSNPSIGSVEGYAGEPDNPTLETPGNGATPLAFSKDAETAQVEKQALTNLDPDRDDPSFVYAGTYTNIDLVSEARTSLSKDVQVNNDGWWSSGRWDEEGSYDEEAGKWVETAGKEELNARNRADNERVVYEGGTYAYRLRMMSEEKTATKNMVLYDSLENFDANTFYEQGNADVDMYTPHWKGKLRSVDTKQLELAGCVPVVYYSTVENLVFSHEGDAKNVKFIDENIDLFNANVWTKASEYEGSLDDVKAIAIDASHKADGSDFQLDPLASATVIVKMQAPSGDAAREYIAQDAHAYNNAYMSSTVVNTDTGDSSTNNVRKDYTKVGLQEYNFNVTKVWNDGANRDGLRPANVTVHLLANGVDTGQARQLSEDTQWKGTFEHIPYTDADGIKIRYSIQEDVPQGYEASLRLNEETDVVVTNTHKPATTSIEGTKIWQGDTEDARPESITVDLYKQIPNSDNPEDLGAAQLVKSKKVKPDKDGEWVYSFDNLFVYEGGKPIHYSVKERANSNGEELKSYVAGTDESNPYNLVNVYHPYGDLLVAKDVEQTTSVSKNQVFTFNFEFTKIGKDGEETPVFDEYAYEVLDAQGNAIVGDDGQPVTGTVTTNGNIQIKGGQRVHIKEIGQGVRYRITEEKADGFTQQSATGDKGTIAPNAQQTASFVNRYAAKGQVSLQATKTLNSRELQRYQFKFELYQAIENEEGFIVDRKLVRTASNARPDTVTKREDGTVESSQASVTFGALNYTQADAGRVFKYMIVESDNGKPGYSYDNRIYWVTVSVADNGDGMLAVTPTYSTERETGALDEGTLPEFVNSYAAKGQIDLRAWKDLQGRRVKDGEFTFELLDGQGCAITRATNNAEGSVVFESAIIRELNFDQDDIGKTYSFGVREVPGDDPTVNYDNSAYGYSVEVLDNGDGTLDFTQGFAEPIYGEGTGKGKSIIGWNTEKGELPVFVNTLKDGSLAVTKNVIVPQGASAEEGFSFRVKLLGDKVTDKTVTSLKLSDASEPQAGVSDVPVKMEDGQFEFTLRGNQTATFAGIPAGTAYQVYEETPDGWVLIEQDGVSGTIEPLETANAQITNRYQPDVTTAQFTGTKTLDGQPAAANEFTFALTETTEGASGSAKMLVDGQEQNVAFPYQVNTSDGGFVQFPVIEYTKDEAGEHTYVIEEVNTNEDTIDYDLHKETVKVNVNIDNNGKLTSSVVYDSDGIRFSNKKRPGELRIAKNVGQRDLTDANKNDIFNFKVTLNGPNGLPLDGNSQIYWYAEDAEGNVVNETTSQPEAPVDESADQNSQQTDPQRAMKKAPATPTLKASANDVASKQQSHKNAALLGEPGTSAKKANAIFHATDEQLEGTAYAVLTNAGELIFFRSNETYTAGTNKTVTDIKGNTYTGQVYVDIETKPANHVPPWYNQIKLVKSVRIANDQAIRPMNTSMWFWNEAYIYGGSGHCDGPESIDLSRLDTSRVESARHMFYGCMKATEIDVSGFDTSHMTNMSNMFKACKAVTDLDVSGFDTSNVTNMSSMFSSCYALKTIDLSRFDTSHVTNMYEMFSGCSGMTQLDVSSLDTSRVTNMEGMFSFCEKLTKLDLSNFNTSNVKTMRTMFWDCYKLKELDLSSFDTSKVEEFFFMFCSCSSLTSLDLSNFSNNDNTSFSDMFDGCRNLESLDISGFNMLNCKSVYGMFNDCNKLSRVVLGENFSFDINGTTTYPAVLPTPPVGTTTGEWVREDKTYGPYSPEDLQSEYDSAHAGVWVWNTNDSSAIVYFDANGGYTSTPKIVLSKENLSVTMPNKSTTSRPHHKLVGWKTATGNTLYMPGQTYEGVAELGTSTTLYAQWDKSNERVYKVRHYQQRENLKGYSLTETETLLADFATEVTPAVKDYEGFKAPATQSVVVAEDDSSVVEYRYDRLRYTVEFDGNGATSGTLTDKLSMIGGVAQDLPKNPYQKEGAIYTGWNTSADGSGTGYQDQQSVNNLTKSDGDNITLYAQWMENPNEALTPQAGVITVSCKAGETVVIPGLPEGTTYTVEEINLPAGWYQDVEASSGTEGAIEANQTTNAAVVNHYQASGELYLTAHKAFEGGELKAGQFTFQAGRYMPISKPPYTPIYKSPARLSSIPMEYRLIGTATNEDVDTDKTMQGADGSETANPWEGTAPVVFGPIMLNEDSIGTEFDVCLNELPGADPTVIYDTHQETVHVKVVDAGHGELEFEVTYDDDGALFTNRTKPGSLRISKEVQDATADDANTLFPFTVMLAGPDGEQLDGEFVAKHHDQSGHEASAVAHTPNVSDTGEQMGDIEGVPYVNTVSILGSESLHLDLTYMEPIDFFNNNQVFCIYQGAIKELQNVQNVTQLVNAIKMLNKQGIRPVRSYTMTSFDPVLKTDGLDIAGDSATIVYYGSSLKEIFGADLEDVFTYGYYAKASAITDYSVASIKSGDTIRLKAGDSFEVEGLPAGATYAVTEQQTEGWMLEDSSGTEGALKAGEVSEARFVNTPGYSTPGGPDPEAELDMANGSTQLVAKKVVTGGIIADDNDFAFQVLNEDGDVVDTAGCDAAGGTESSVTFAPIYYTQKDMVDSNGDRVFQKVFTYYIQEKAGADADVTYDKHIYTATVTVTDDTKGYLQTSVVYKDNKDNVLNEGDVPTFINELKYTSVAGKKIWNDGDNRDGKRPESITVNLLRDGKVIDSKNVTAADDWAWQWDSLPLSKGNGELAYTVSEEPVEGYETSVDGYDITNTYAPETVDVPVIKKWNDADNQDKTRPESVTVKLLANGTAVDTCTLSAENEWTHKFTGLFKYEGGKEIAYTVEEEVPAGYTATVTGDMAEGYTVTNTPTTDEPETPTTQPPTPPETPTTPPSTPTTPVDEPPTPTTGVEESETPLTSNNNETTLSVDEPDTPTTKANPRDKTGKKEVTIKETETPTSHAVKTGDVLAGTTAIVMIAALAIGVITLIRRRRENE